jgi:hypothetical protein
MYAFCLIFDSSIKRKDKMKTQLTNQIQSLNHFPIKLVKQAEAKKLMTTLDVVFANKLINKTDYKLLSSLLIGMI